MKQSWILRPRGNPQPPHAWTADCMTNHPLHDRAQKFTTAHVGLVDRQIHALVTLLLERLLDELGDVPEASVCADDEPYARVSRDQNPESTKQVDLEAALARGGRAVLLVGAGEDPEHTQDVARRYLGPIVTCLDLLRTLQAERDQAQDAVQAVESTALFDLATGVVMARKGTDSRTARNALQAWSERTGTRMQDLSPTELLDVLTGEEL